MQTKKLRKPGAVGVVALTLALSLLLAGQAQATTFADVSMIKKGGGGWVGVGVISNDGSGQTLKAKVPAGTSEVFLVCVENQSGGSSVITATSSGDKGKLLATWHDDQDNSRISDSEMTMGYSRSVSAGDSLCLMLKIKAKASARSGLVRSWSITGSSGMSVSDTGVIKIKVP